MAVDVWQRTEVDVLQSSYYLLLFCTQQYTTTHQLGSSHASLIFKTYSRDANNVLGVSTGQPLSSSYNYQQLPGLGNGSLRSTQFSFCPFMIVANSVYITIDFWVGKLRSTDKSQFRSITLHDRDEQYLLQLSRWVYCTVGYFVKQQAEMLSKLYSIHV